MGLRMKKTVLGSVVLMVVLVFVYSVFSFNAVDTASSGHRLKHSYTVYYPLGDKHGISHVGYRDIDEKSDEYVYMYPREREKVDKIKKTTLHSKHFNPEVVISGYEITGILKVKNREQAITYKKPDKWNSRLVVLGTPGLRNEYANEAFLVQWLVESGYAVISGDKGMAGGMDDMYSGSHPTQHWGQMMIDLAKWAKQQLEKNGETIRGVYAIGLSNGGYQVRRALEIDHARVSQGKKRLFNGGVDWSGTYWPASNIMDQDGDGKVSVSEFSNSRNLVSMIDTAVKTMGWAYSDDGLTTPVEFHKTPPFADVHGAMGQAGFSGDSSVFWGFYNSNFDAYKALAEVWKGVGYFNLVSSVYRAEIKGDTKESAEHYQHWYNPSAPDSTPQLYSFLAFAGDGGWVHDDIKWALKNANTGEFSVPLISLHGNADGLLGLQAMGIAYQKAVQKFGAPELHRLYIIANAGHVDAHADGKGDFDFDGQAGNEGVENLLTPMQAYAQKAFFTMVDWVENGIAPPAGKLIETDPVNDITDHEQVSWE